MASRTIGRGARRTGRKSSAKSPRAAVSAELQTALLHRLQRHVSSAWSEAKVDIVVRFRGRFAYVGYIERPQAGLRDGVEVIPVPLFRLGFTGDPRRWHFALVKFSDPEYESCLGASGSFSATPEQAFDCAAGLYLR